LSFLTLSVEQAQEGTCSEYRAIEISHQCQRQ